MAREFFCAYHSYLKSIEPLTDAEKGRLFVSCLQYSMTGATPDLRGNERFLFPMMKEQIDRDNKKYSDKCEKQRQNAKMRWDATACQCMPTDDKHAKEKEKEKEKETTFPISPPGNARSDAFETFWDAYPRHVAKDKARTAFKAVPLKEIPALMESLEKHKRSDQWTKDGGQFVPHPATWLNQKRWQGDAPPAGKGKRTEYAQHAVETVDFSHLMANLEET